jgi:lauroyl/myristoyl acyltransferase
MSIGAHLLNKENLEFVRRVSFKIGRQKILELGLRYYEAHPQDVKLIVENLAHFGLSSDGRALDEVLEQMVVHYFEKLFVLVKTYEAFWIIKNKVEFGDSLEPFLEARAQGKAVFIGQSHFGATYLMGMVLMANGFDIHTVGKFPEPVGGLLTQSIATMHERYGTGRARLLNLADPGVDVPMEMIGLLMQRKIVSNVFDEHNKFCRPMSILGRKVMGGTGMDLILRNFKDDNTVIVTPFLVRTGEDTFRYEVDRHRLTAGDIIESFYRSLQKRVVAHPSQWYFIHEVHESFADD